MWKGKGYCYREEKMTTTRKRFRIVDVYMGKLQAVKDNQSSLGFANLFWGMSVGSDIKNSIVF